MPKKAKSKKVRIGFVGVGGMGQCAHLRNYVINPDCEVVALAEIRGDLRKKVAVHYNVPRTYKNHEEMLAKEKLDGIVASQPFNRHGILLPDLLKAGVPVFTEKPLAATVEVGEKIVKAVKKSGTWHMVGYHKRSDPASMYVKAEIKKLKASGELGKMKYIRIVMPSGDWVAEGFSDYIKPEGKTPELKLDPPASDMDKKGNDMFFCLVNFYIHQINYMRYLLGEPYDVSYADPSGVIMVCHSKSGIPCVLEMDPYNTTIDWDETAHVGFERGYINITLPAPLAVNRPAKVQILKDPKPGRTPQIIIPQLPWIHAMRQQAANFVAAIRGEIKPPCEAAEALEDLKLARRYLKLWKGI